MSTPKVVLVFAIVAGGGLAAWVALARGGPEIPDPVTPDMLEPVAEAIRTAREAVLATPDSSAAWGAFASMCDAHELYDVAAAAYRRAHELAPNEFRWIYLLAIVEDFRGSEPEQIWACFREAIARNPIYPPLFVRYGDALVRQGELTRARDAYRRGVDLDPDFAMANRGLGQVLLALGDPQTALIYLDTSARREPNDGILWATIARAYQSLGEEDQADAAAVRARELPRTLGLPDPLRYAVDTLARSPDACLRRANEALARNDLAGAIQDLEWVAQMLPDDPAHHVRLANILGYTNDLPGAIEHFERAAALRATSVEMNHNWGTALMRSNRLPEAAERFRAAITLNPRSPNTLYNLGAVLERMGQRDEALDAYRQAVAIEPGHAAGQDVARLQGS